VVGKATSLGVQLRGCGPGDTLVGRDGVEQGLDHRLILRDVHGDYQGAVDAGTEALGDEIVGATLGAGSGQRAVVGGAQTKTQHRRSQRQKQDGDADGIGPGVLGHVPTPTLPARAHGRAIGWFVSLDPETVDPVPGKTEERR
jgi:hypothetical protein